MKKLLCVFFALTAISILYTCSIAEEIKKVEEKSFKLKKGSSIFIEADEGDISVKGWDKNEIYVKIIKTAYGRTRKRAEDAYDEIDVRIRNTDDRLTIQDLTNERRNINFRDLFDSDTYRRRTRVDFELSVPAGMVLDLKGDEGNLEITGVSAEIYIDQNEGDVDLMDIESEKIKVTMDEGELKCTNLNEKVKSNRCVFNIDADENDIDIRNSYMDKLDIKSDESGIFIRNCAVQNMYVDTDEGDIEIECNVNGPIDYDLVTDEGDVYVVMRGNPSAKVDLYAEDSYIESDYKLKITERDDGKKGYGSIGSGKSGRLHIRTSEGKIKLLKK